MIRVEAFELWVEAAITMHSTPSACKGDFRIRGFRATRWATYAHDMPTFDFPDNLTFFQFVSSVIKPRL